MSHCYSLPDPPSCLLLPAPAERLVHLMGNPYISFMQPQLLELLSRPGKADHVAADLKDMPAVLKKIKRRWVLLPPPGPAATARGRFSG